MQNYKITLTRMDGTTRHDLNIYYDTTREMRAAAKTIANAANFIHACSENESPALRYTSSLRVRDGWESIETKEVDIKTEGD